MGGSGHCAHLCGEGLGWTPSWTVALYALHQANGTSKLSSQAPCPLLFSRPQQEHDIVGQKHTSLGHQPEDSQQWAPRAWEVAKGNSNNLGASPRSQHCGLSLCNPNSQPELLASCLTCSIRQSLICPTDSRRRTRSSSEDQISGWIHSFRQGVFFEPLLYRSDATPRFWRCSSKLKGRQTPARIKLVLMGFVVGGGVV